MLHELFTDLSAEQQEVVAGGLSTLDFSTLYAKAFQQTETISPVGSSSGLGGSSLLAGGVLKTIQEAIQTASSFKAVVS
ncbi:CTB family bacteriocin [Nostoc sp. CENA67]|uniref:CTB family bacteriocin n=1 Tax=Amazonocrinis nigriterrae CENA67 TaxID=2794033 RepID=A0A8J7L9F6_9NOST|nr:CTB family bacteriocin [Amazonocrinis nigriterrae]MBH8562906.1 CTB family bacteriocin [Amazonocrinis nigriterrae CENA67]